MNSERSKHVIPWTICYGEYTPWIRFSFEFLSLHAQGIFHQWFPFINIVFSAQFTLQGFFNFLMLNKICILSVLDFHTGIATIIYIINKLSSVITQTQLNPFFFCTNLGNFPWNGIAWIIVIRYLYTKSCKFVNWICTCKFRGRLPLLFFVIKMLECSVVSLLVVGLGPFFKGCCW